MEPDKLNETVVLTVHSREWLNPCHACGQTIHAEERAIVEPHWVVRHEVCPRPNLRLIRGGLSEQLALFAPSR